MKHPPHPLRSLLLLVLLERTKTALHGCQGPFHVGNPLLQKGCLIGNLLPQTPPEGVTESSPETAETASSAMSCSITRATAPRAPALPSSRPWPQAMRSCSVSTRHTTSPFHRPPEGRHECRIKRDVVIHHIIPPAVPRLPPLPGTVPRRHGGPMPPYWSSASSLREDRPGQRLWSGHRGQGPHRGSSP